MRRHRLPVVLLPILLPVLAPGPIPAQETYPAADVEALAAPEGAAYARVRHVEGRISLLQDSGLAEDEIEINTPVGPGDILGTGLGARLELQLADGTLVRLDESSRLEILALADWETRYENRTLLSLDAGAAAVQLDNFDPEEKVFRIDTDAATIFLLEDGSYRVDVGAGGGTQVRSRAGVAEVLAADQSILVRSGEGTFVAPGYVPDTPRVVSTRGGDAFDRYLEERRLAYFNEVRGAGRSYAAYDDDIPVVVRPYLVELDTHGSWRHHPSYGVIWVPVASPHWRPYYHGRWVHRPFGWTWVSYDPWGYAPYHYGRWEYLTGYGWAWLPGAVYAPAWVSWGYYGGYVGWSPLGWYDYPTGWRLSLSFGTFHHPHWSFVAFHNFHVRHVEKVIVKERIIERDVIYASRAPRLSREDIRARRERAVFEQARQEARRSGAAARDPGSRRMEERSFRQRERTVLAAARGRDNSTPTRPGFGRDTLDARGTSRGPAARGAERPSRPTAPGISRSPSRGRGEPGRSPAGGTIRRTPAVASGEGAPARRGPARRPQARPESQPRAGADRGPEGSQTRGRPDSARPQGEPGHRPPTDTRRVPASEPRRLLNDTRTRRSTPAPSRVERTPPAAQGRQPSPPARRSEPRVERTPSRPAPSSRPSARPPAPRPSSPPSRVQQRPAPSGSSGSTARSRPGPSAGRSSATQGRSGGGRDAGRGSKASRDNNGGRDNNLGKSDKAGKDRRGQRRD